MSPLRSPGDGPKFKSPAEVAAELQHQRAEKRSFDLEEQRADTNSPEVRIRAWERMHALKMPSDPEHPVLDVIAVETHLTLSEVREEQRLRAEGRAQHAARSRELV